MLMEREGILVVISGFAGVGKGTIVKGLIAGYDNYALSVSMTTRQPREGEVEGQSYFFVTKEEFEKKIEENGLIEHACYVGNYYGTPRAYVEDMLAKGKDVILEIEIQGARNIKKQYPDAVLIFVCPPSASELKNRLVGRGTETPDVVEKRMRRAVEESEGIFEYDYIVVNDEVDKAIAVTHNIIETMHCAPKRNRAFVTSIQNELEDIAKGE